MFNAAAYFVDRHIEQNREPSIAIECGDRRLTYRDLYRQVNRVGNAPSALGDDGDHRADQPRPEPGRREQQNAAELQAAEHGRARHRGGMECLP